MKTNKYKDKSNCMGEIIASARKSANISQNKLASKMQLMGVNIGKNDISKIECSKRIIKDYELIAIKDILNISLDNVHL